MENGMPPRLLLHVDHGPVVTYRRIDPVADADIVYANYCDTFTVSFGGDNRRCSSRDEYLKWLASRIEEFPDGHVLATLSDRGSSIVIGQLELQVPYGLCVGYVNHFFVAHDWRRLGFGRQLHEEYAERYFRAWEADMIELHVSPTNHAAAQFYRSLGYTLAAVETKGDRMWRMQRRLARTAATDGLTA